MEAIIALHTRVSQPALVAPAPTGDAWDDIAKAALRAADHAMLRPWRFLVLTGADLERLGALFLTARLVGEPDISERERERTRSRPLRAPMVVVAIAKVKAGAKVPAVEQILSAGAAVQNLINAAHARGYGAMWRTGEFAYDPVVKAGLGLDAAEQLVGFVYLGTVAEARKASPALDPAAFFGRWD